MWNPAVTPFAWELATGCALVGPRGGSPDANCAARSQMGRTVTDDIVHMLTRCEIIVAL